MYKRRNYLINKKLQISLTIKILFVAIMLSLFMVYEVYITAWPVISQFVPKSQLVIVKNQILFRMMFFMIPAIFVICTFSILLSHRIAGPIYHLEQTLDAIAAGEDVADIHFRKNDEFKGLAKKINIVIDIIRIKKMD